MNLAISEYTPIVKTPDVYATYEYDRKTADEVSQMRRDLGKEAEKLGLKGKPRGDYVKA